RGFSSHLGLHSIPTRRSSDLHTCGVHDRRRSSTHGKRVPCISSYEKGDDPLSTHDPKRYYQTINLIEETGASEHSIRRYVRVLRSEEHTSELQSRFELVCRLL